MIGSQELQLAHALPIELHLAVALSKFTASAHEQEWAAHSLDSF